MKTTVKLLSVDADGKEVVRGGITWDGEEWGTLKDSGLEKLVLDTEIFVKNKFVTKDDPQAFLDGLQYQYKSAYLRASAPQKS